MRSQMINILQSTMKVFLAFFVYDIGSSPYVAHSSYQSVSKGFYCIDMQSPTRSLSNSLRPYEFIFQLTTKYILYNITRLSASGIAVCDRDQSQVPGIIP